MIDLPLPHAPLTEGPSDGQLDSLYKQVADYNRDMLLLYALEDAKSWILECYRAWASPEMASSMMRDAEGRWDMACRMTKINLAIDAIKRVEE